MQHETNITHYLINDYILILKIKIKLIILTSINIYTTNMDYKFSKFE